MYKHIYCRNNLIFWLQNLTAVSKQVIKSIVTTRCKNKHWHYKIPHMAPWEFVRPVNSISKHRPIRPKLLSNFLSRHRSGFRVTISVSVHPSCTLIPFRSTALSLTNLAFLCIPSRHHFHLQSLIDIKGCLNSSQVLFSFSKKFLISILCHFLDIVLIWVTISNKSWAFQT